MSDVLLFNSQTKKFNILCNTFNFEFQFNGFSFNSLEQCMNFYMLDDSESNIKSKILNSGSTIYSKILSIKRNLKLKNNWDSIKINLMRELLEIKLSYCPNFRDILNSTHNKTLIFQSFDDSYWGCGSDFKGKNILGGLLMELREKTLNNTPFSNDELNMISYAFRYTLSRSSYAPIVSQNYIFKNIYRFPISELVKFCEEIEEHSSWGMAMDKQSWFSFKKQLEDFISENK